MVGPSSKPDHTVERSRSDDESGAPTRATVCIGHAATARWRRSLIERFRTDRLPVAMAKRCAFTLPPTADRKACHDAVAGAQAPSGGRRPSPRATSHARRAVGPGASWPVLRDGLMKAQEQSEQAMVMAACCHRSAGRPRIALECDLRSMPSRRRRNIAWGRDTPRATPRGSRYPRGPHSHGVARSASDAFSLRNSPWQPIQ